MGNVKSARVDANSHWIYPFAALVGLLGGNAVGYLTLGCSNQDQASDAPVKTSEVVTLEERLKRLTDWSMMEINQQHRHADQQQQTLKHLQKRAGYQERL